MDMGIDLLDEAEDRTNIMHKLSTMHKLIVAEILNGFVAPEAGQL